MKYFLVIFCSILSIFAKSQTTIKMQSNGGVSLIPCKINGLSLSFIFDTGASDVSISLTEARFMFKNGYLKKSDLIGSERYLNASGEVNEGYTINLKSIEFAGLKIYNVKASIVNNLNAPLLLGQSAIKKLGKFEVDFNSNTITIQNGKGEYDFTDNEYTKKNDYQLKSSHTLDEISSLFEKNKFDLAKNAIEDFLSDQKNISNSVAWYYKGRIYNSLSRGLSISLENSFEYKKISFDAFKKNQELDISDSKLKNESYKSYLDIFLGFYDIGAKLFDEKRFKLSTSAFIQALEVEKFMVAKNYTFKELIIKEDDAPLIKNIASAAYQSGNNDIAFAFYLLLIYIDENAEENIYNFLINHLESKGDTYNIKIIKAKARKKFPQNSLFK